MAPSTRPALAHDTACSALRPPNTTATLILRCSLIRSPPLLSQPPDRSACAAPGRLPRRFVPGAKVRVRLWCCFLASRNGRAVSKERSCDPAGPWGPVAEGCGGMLWGPAAARQDPASEGDRRVSNTDISGFNTYVAPAVPS